MFFVGPRQTRQPRAGGLLFVLIAVIASIAFILRHKRDPLRPGWALEAVSEPVA
jgi:hypothetical protein